MGFPTVPRRVVVDGCEYVFSTQICLTEKNCARCLKYFSEARNTFDVHPLESGVREKRIGSVRWDGSEWSGWCVLVVFTDGKPDYDWEVRGDLQEVVAGVAARIAAARAQRKEWGGPMPPVAV